MKKAILIIALLLLAGLMLLAVELFGDRHGVDLPPTVSQTESPTTGTQAPTEEPSAMPTEPEPTEPQPTETQPPVTEPEAVLVESGKVFLVNSVRLPTFVEEGTELILAEAEAYLAALGLDEAGTAHYTDKQRIDLSKDGLSLRVGEKTYEQTYGGKLYLPVYEFAEDFGYPAWVDDVYGGIYITTGARVFEMTQSVNVPVLMYHAVSDNCWGSSDLFVSPKNMEAQLKYLVENDYDPIWFEDLAHIEDYDKPVILTFDDGYDDNYTELFPLLQKYNVKATIFVIAKDTVGIAHKLTEEQIRELSDSGLVSIQSHGYSHGFMDSMTAEELEFELTESKKIISRITGKTPYVLCYPSGKFNNQTMEIGAKHYNFGLKMVGGMYNTSDAPFLVSRYYMARNTDIYTFASYIDGAGT